MKDTKKNKKLELHRETLRNLQPQELKQAAGGRAAYPTETEIASGCTVTDTTCDTACQTWGCW